MTATPMFEKGLEDKLWSRCNHNLDVKVELDSASVTGCGLVGFVRPAFAFSAGGMSWLSMRPRNAFIGCAPITKVCTSSSF